MVYFEGYNNFVVTNGRDGVEFCRRKSTFCIETVDLEETGNSQKQGLPIAVPNEKSG